MFEFVEDDFLREGVTTKNSVIKVMGLPTIISDISDDEVWIYYSEDVKKFLFFEPEILSRNIVAIRFDRGETVKDLKKLTLDDEARLSFVSKSTAVDGHKTNFLKSIFSNIGQVRPQ